MLRLSPAACVVVPLLLGTLAHAQEVPATNAAHGDDPPAPDAGEVPATPPAELPAAAADPETTDLAGPASDAATAPVSAPKKARCKACNTPRFPALRAGGFTVRPRLRLRTGFQYIQPDADVRFVGGNDGFYLEQGRLGLEAAWRDTVTLRLIVDATSALPGGSPNDPVRPAIAALRDAYVEWAPSPYFSLLAGQALLPFLAEGAVSRAEMNFIARSVMADGVRAGQGFFEPGLSPDRELGVTVGARRAPVGDAFVQYLLTVANGNGQNRLGNDNKLPALLGRLGGGLGRLVEAGVAMQYNPRTVGELPNLYNETDVEFAADLRVRALGFDWLGQAAYRTTSFDTVFPEGDPAASDQALGFTSWLVLSDPLGLPTFGIKPGYRFSYYDPRSSSAEDQLYEHTLGIRYDPPGGGPVALLIDATLLFEGGASGEGTRQLDNHRVGAMLQFDL